MLFLVSEVTKGMWAKKQAKMKRNSSESAQKSNQIKERIDKGAKSSEPEDNKVNKSQPKFWFLMFLLSSSLSLLNLHKQEHLDWFLMYSSFV